MGGATSSYIPPPSVSLSDFLSKPSKKILVIGTIGYD